MESDSYEVLLCLMHAEKMAEKVSYSPSLHS